MASNVEIKARVDDRAALIARVQAIATSGPTEIAQVDTFFHATHGRLKLREFGDGTGVLVFYDRPDATGPKESFYVLSQTNEPDTLRDALTRAHGQLGRVVKQRTLYLVGRTRVHVDRVDGLGDFMELEVVLREDESLEAGMEEAARIMATLGIAQEQLVKGAYFDLLVAQGSTFGCAVGAMT
ncbi:MAG: class IV adenylate cyclase [Betaproteobacteria bacterium]|nr:class IV adenylate cyclase [Betaproteobacteria bacterium]